MADPAPDQPYQSLYRRFRPQQFAEVRGQDHITRALRNAVREGRVAHAYLFSGPRGTGKTSSARILAKALNCTDLKDGEPCGVCPSCVGITSGASLDVHELDAASNNGVDAMRDLVARAALGTPGRWKVYIVDEVHMLSAAASNALLKTLEEPPGHVVFVLATTDPQKVLPTIRSRTQHFEFRLLPGEVLAGLLTDVNQSAGLGVSPEAIELVMRRGNGSARDALSVLDQVAAAGEVGEDPEAYVEELVDAIADRDAGRALVAVAEACASGRDARRLANDVLEHLRNAFLLAMKAGELVPVPDVARDRLVDQAARLGNAGLTRVMETIGQTVVDMREALDPRITLEVAIVRLSRPDADASPGALLERIERLERGLAGQVTEPARAAARAAVEEHRPPATPRASDGARAALGALRGTSPAPPPATSAPTPGPTPGPKAAPNPPSPNPPSPPATGPLPSRDDLTKAWGDDLLLKLPPRSKSRFAGGRFLSVENGVAVYALPNDIHRQRCEEVRPEVESVLAAHFGTAVPLRLVVDAESAPPPPGAEPPDEHVEIDELRDAPPAVTSPEERLLQAFPGAEEVDQG
ncbi:MAG TPA: DNA polymerase III subunit gamma/tau [Acidimicrobiales bacterium]|nr:DNA polymerase III subunit gamma/tau [Acidimicrobiales bacterium]